MPLYGWNGSVTGASPAGLLQGGGLLNTAGNYSFPLTSGLLGGLGSAPQGVPNYSQTALQMAGNPHAGPYAQVPLPSGVGVPGAIGMTGGSVSSGGSTGSQILGGLLGIAARDPQLLKQGVGLVQDAYGYLTGAPTASAVLAGSAPAMADVTAGTGAGLQSAADAAYADASNALGGAPADAAATDAAATANTGASAGSSLAGIAGPAIGIGLAGLLADKMFSGFGPMGIEVPGTDAYNSHVTDMMTGYFQPKDLTQSVVSPTAQGQYANLPANWTGQFGAAGDSHYFPSANGTVVATPDQYQQAMNLFGQAQTGADKNGAKPMNPQALQSFLSYVNGLPAAPAGFSLLNQTGTQFANMTAQQRAAYTQNIDAAVQGLLSQGIMPGALPAGVLSG